MNFRIFVKIGKLFQNFCTISTIIYIKSKKLIITINPTYYPFFSAKNRTHMGCGLKIYCNLITI